MVYYRRSHPDFVIVIVPLQIPTGAPVVLIATARVPGVVFSCGDPVATNGSTSSYLSLDIVGVNSPVRNGSWDASGSPASSRAFSALAPSMEK